LAEYIWIVSWALFGGLQGETTGSWIKIFSLYRILLTLGLAEHNKRVDIYRYTCIKAREEPRLIEKVYRPVSKRDPVQRSICSKYGASQLTGMSDYTSREQYLNPDPEIGCQ
jgi:hypothetical protein